MKNATSVENAIQPSNLAAERSVLGALIENGDLLSEAQKSGLRTDDFYISDHRRVYDAILALRARIAPIDYVMVAEQLGNQPQDYVLVSSLIEGVVIQKSHVLHHVDIVRRKSRLRALLTIGDSLTNAVNESADPDALIIHFVRQLDQLKSLAAGAHHG